MVNPVEMASPEAHVAEQLKGIPGYRDPFAKAFPGEPDPVTLANAEKAIVVFEATLITPNAPFDRFLKGEAGALSPAQKSGLALFMDKGCSACHNGINIGGGMYAPFGVAEKPGAELLPPADQGRFMVTKTPSDEYVFKVPTLRNITLTAPYFHTGQAWDLRQAVAVMGTSQLGTQLTDNEVDKITAFLGSLTGEQPKVTYPILPPHAASAAVIDRKGQPMNQWCTAFTAPAEATVTITSASAAAANPMPMTTPSRSIRPRASKQMAVPGATWPRGMGRVMIAARSRQISPIGIFVQSVASHAARGRTSRSKRST